MADVFERTWIDDLVDEAEQRGERRAEHRGEIRASQAVLKQVLRHRFGGLGAEVERRIDGIADVTLLQELMDRALDVASLDDMFTAP